MLKFNVEEGKREFSEVFALCQNSLNIIIALFLNRSSRNFVSAVFFPFSSLTYIIFSRQSKKKAVFLQKIAHKKSNNCIIVMMCAVNNLKRPRDNSSLSSERAVKSLKSSTVIMRPQEYILSISKAKTVRSSELVNFFHKYSQTEVEAYGMDVTSAVRSRDLNKLKALHEEGQLLQCSNRFGESILHMACRQGNFEMVQYLINEGNVSVRIKDDFGRTPMHDAFWSAAPNFDLVDFLIEICPSLLYISDVRGHSPLQYVRKEHESSWTPFLEKRKQTILRGVKDIEQVSS